MNGSIPETYFQAQKNKNLVLERKRFVIISLSVLFALLFVLFLVDHFFVIRSITVVSESPFYTEQEVIEATGLKLGQKLFSFSEEEVRLELLRKLSYFSDAQISKRFPFGVEISFEEISGTMYVDVDREHYILSPDFRVIARASEQDLSVKTRMHVITTDVRRCVVGEEIVIADSAQLALLQQIYGALAAENMAEQVEYLDATNRFHITLNYGGRWEVDLGDSTELSYKVRMLRKVIESAAQDYGTNAGGKIDVSGVREAILQLYTEDGAAS